LKFTKETKNPERNFKFKILEVLWKNIYADGVLDIYESTFNEKS
tara:strand:- start:294 stop:425 length:132 start_codon:yes stop_codon:yes gene_type:complete